MILRRLLFVSLILLSIPNLYAQVPRALSYQGVLTDSAGRPKPDGSYSFAFRLYPSASGGTALWTETKTLLVSRGLFSTALGDQVALNLSFDAQYWLSIQVAADPELSPRIPLTSVGYSIHALKADTARYAQLGGGGGTNYWTANGNDIANTNSGNVGIGTAPLTGYKLDINGATRMTPGGSGGVINFGTPSAETGMTIIGNNRADFRFDGSSVKLLAATGTGVPASTSGIIITTAGNVGIGTTSSTAKLYVAAAIGGEYAVYADNTANSGSSFGGVVGRAYGFGVSGIATSTSGGHYGVYGSTLSQASGYGVYSNGNMGASGTKPFRIDHPKDPTGKYLLHYSAESPDVLNMYTGNVVTDGSGYASITLPDYFEEINKDPRYTLTVINEGGTDFVQAMVVQKIRNNQFAIRTSKPAIEVSWEVKALRNDLWVRTYGAPVQVEKQGPERGKYQHPELYGMPKEMGMNYRPEKEHVGTPPPEKEKQ